MRRSPSPTECPPKHYHRRTHKHWHGHGGGGAVDLPHGPSQVSLPLVPLVPGIALEEVVDAVTGERNLGHHHQAQTQDRDHPHHSSEIMEKEKEQEKKIHCTVFCQSMLLVLSMFLFCWPNTIDNIFRDEFWFSYLHSFPGTKHAGHTFISLQVV